MVDNLPTNCLSVFDHFVGLALKGLIFNTESRVNFLRIFPRIYAAQKFTKCWLFSLLPCSVRIRVKVDQQKDSVFKRFWPCYTRMIFSHMTFLAIYNAEEVTEAAIERCSLKIAVHKFSKNKEGWLILLAKSFKTSVSFFSDTAFFKNFAYFKCLLWTHLYVCFWSHSDVIGRCSNFFGYFAKFLRRSLFLKTLQAEGFHDSISREAFAERCWERCWVTLLYLFFFT